MSWYQLFVCTNTYSSKLSVQPLSCCANFVIMLLLLCPGMYSWSHQNIFVPLAQSSSGEQEARLWLTFCVVAMMEVSLFWTSGLLMEIQHKVCSSLMWSEQGLAILLLSFQHTWILDWLCPEVTSLCCLFHFVPPAHKIVSREIMKSWDQMCNIVTEAEIGNHETVHAPIIHLLIEFEYFIWGVLWFPCHTCIPLFKHEATCAHEWVK